VERHGWPLVPLRSGAARRRIAAAGTEHEVEFTPIEDPALLDRIDAAYEQKYAGSSYLPPMLEDGPRDATVEITPRTA
jgi:hypothetical protein